MRIAFVGKGGSGKSTLSALFIDYLSKKVVNSRILAIDADLNIHLPILLGIKDNLSTDKYLSNSFSVSRIKEFLKGGNNSIVANGAFRKTTPPTSNSNFIDLRDENGFFLKNFTHIHNNIHLSVVGSYEKDGIGTSCYHGSLAILENILSHTIDYDNYIVADMTAGTDAFSNSMHIQFDYYFIVVEPTIRSIEVYKQFLSLATEAGIADKVKLIANKILDKEDIDFINSQVKDAEIFGSFGQSKYIKMIDRGNIGVNSSELESENQVILKDIFELIQGSNSDYQARYEKLIELHKKYIKKDFVTERYGDISNQIEPGFNFNDVIEKLNQK